MIILILNVNHCFVFNHLKCILPTYFGISKTSYFLNFKCLQFKMPWGLGWWLFTAFNNDHSLSHKTKRVCERICL